MSHLKNSCLTSSWAGFCSAGLRHLSVVIIAAILSYLCAGNIMHVTDTIAFQGFWQKCSRFENLKGDQNGSLTHLTIAHPYPESGAAIRLSCPPFPLFNQKAKPESQYLCSLLPFISAIPYVSHNLCHKAALGLLTHIWNVLAVKNLIFKNQSLFILTGKKAGWVMKTYATW